MSEDDDWGRPVAGSTEYARVDSLKGHLLIVFPIGYIEHSPTRFTTPNKKSDAIVVDLVDLDAPDEYGNYGKVYRTAWWRSSKLIVMLRPFIGKKVLGRITQGVATNGMNPPWVIDDTSQNANDVERAKAWRIANPDFVVSPFTPPVPVPQGQYSVPPQSYQPQAPQQYQQQQFQGYQQGPPPQQQEYQQQAPQQLQSYQQGPPPQQFQGYQQGPPPQQSYQQGPPPQQFQGYQQGPPPQQQQAPQGPPPQQGYQQQAPQQLQGYQQGPPTPQQGYQQQAPQEQPGMLSLMRAQRERRESQQWQDDNPPF